MIEILTSTATLITFTEEIIDGMAEKIEDETLDFPTKRLNASKRTLEKFSCSIENISKEYSVFWALPCLCVKTGDVVELDGQRYDVVRAIVLQDENGCDYMQKILTFKIR